MPIIMMTKDANRLLSDVPKGTVVTAVNLTTEQIMDKELMAGALKEMLEKLEGP